MIVGNLIVMVSLLLQIFVLTENSSTGMRIGLLMLYGAGFGCLILENMVPDMAAASAALIRFLLQFGLAVMVTISFSVMNSEIDANLKSLHQMNPFLYHRNIESGSYRDHVKISLIQDREVQTTLNSIYIKSISKVYYTLITMCSIANERTLLVKIPKMSE
ncbi:hypothetical protein K501DRAFT_265394 [Backusella circina FSU 941]|nr:hypothetical protein K501DRAFT_265394 [Backusella circina FSU 941]